MASLALALLGPFQATLDDLPIEGLRSDWRRALLAYLAVESERERPREQVASLLWPERPDREALSALRYALSNLRSALGDRRSAGDRRSPGDRGAASPFLLVTHTSVQFNPDSDHWLDVAEFQERSSRSDVAGLERAASLYRGPFLDGLSVRDSPAFDEWMLLKGEETRRRMLSVLGRLTSLQMARGEYAEAARWAQRQLELEPYREQAHRQLMVGLALGGERSAALAHYEACRRLLAQELGCEPEDETRALYTRIRDGGLSQPWPQPPASPVILATVPPTEPPSRFVARQEELARLSTLLDRALAGHGGVALISGEPGSGKTALLDEFARQAGQAHDNLIALRGRCNAHGGAGDPYLPFRRILQSLAGDVEGKRASGTISTEQARRAWEALPVVGTALVECGPDLIDSFVPGEALLRRAEAFPVPAGPARPLGRSPSGQVWLARLREIIRRAGESTTPVADPGPAALPPQPDLFAQLTKVLQTVSMSRPMLLVIDDLQWADGGTAALLFHLGRRLAGSRILLACAYRPQALSPQWGGGAAASQESQVIASSVETVLRELAREWGDVRVDLDATDGRAFVEAYVDSEPNRLGKAFRQALYDHTAGNPLFTTELLRSFERGRALVKDEGGRWVAAAGLDWGSCPPKVEAVIAGHLAGLPDEDRALLQAASVQGEQFIAEVVARVVGWDEEAVVRCLSGPLRTRQRLVEAVSLDRLESSGQCLSRYRFRHALVQGNAYHSLDAVQRARLHETTGHALEVIYALAAGQAEGKPSSLEPLRYALAPDLARHFEAAGMPLQATRYRLEAGRWSMRLAAYDEAITHLERGLALLESMPASLERLHLELALLLALVNPAVLQRGFQTPKLERTLARLFELTGHPDLKDDPRRLTALVLLGLASSWSADPERGQRVGQQLLELAPSAGSGQAQDGGQPYVMLAHWVLGHCRLLQGQPVAAREQLGQTLALHNPEASRPLSLLFPGEPSVIGRVELGYALWLLGYPDQGRSSLRQALALAQEIDQPRTTALAHILAGMLYTILGRDGAEALKHAQALPTLGEVGQLYLAWAELLAGQAGTAVPRSDLAQGFDPAEEARSAVQAMGSGVGHAMQQLFQAQTLLRAGQAAMALEAVDKALAWIERTGVQLLEAEVWRVRGELLLGAEGAAHLTGALHLDVAAEAEACFHRALEVAQEQQARWLELRASVSLARLWQAQARHNKARELLTGIYGWFTEGFDTVDLVEAKALLDGLV